MKNLRARALVVEDDSSWQQILSEVLSDCGLVVDVAGSLEAAQASLRADSHRIAVVDLSLSGDDPHNQDGLRVLEAIRRLDPGCAFVLVTGFATVELAVSALTEYKALSCLRKEAFQRSQLRDLVHQALSSAPAKPAEIISRRPTGEDPSSEYLPVRVAQLALVVEDDAGWRGILSELVADAGYQVRLCGSYGEALGYLRREKLNLAIVDLSLSPGRDAWDEALSGDELEGYRLLASIRAAGIPAIVVSGVGSPKDIERAYDEQGIFSYMEKQSFDRRVFMRIMKEAVENGRAATELDALTDREREVLDLLARGKTNKEIADSLIISQNTVKRHIKAIFKKLGIHTRSAAAAKAAEINS